MQTQSHNLYGQHGPRCPVCSGLGRVIILGSSGMPTKSSSQCGCKGTGIDLELIRENKMESLDKECRRLQQEYMKLRIIVD